MRKILLLSFSLLLLYPACLIKPLEEQADPFDQVFDDDLITPINNMYAGLVNLYLISADEFLRVDSDGEVVERRRIDLTFRQFSRPILSENVFARVVRTDDDTRVVEFNLTKVANQQVTIDLDEISAVAGREINPEIQSHYGGAFNDRGDQLMIPFPNNTYYSFVLFDIQLNGTNSEFQSVTINQVVEADDLPYDLKDGLSNISFVNGNYYASSLNGAVRINPQGQKAKIFQQWIVDIFEYDGKLYATDVNTGVYESEDNGLSWDQVNEEREPTGLFFVENVNDQLVTQRFAGAAFDIVEDDLKSTVPMLFNKDFPSDLGAYNNMRYFRGKFYLAVQKQLWSSDKLVERDE